MKLKSKWTETFKDGDYDEANQQMELFVCESGGTGTKREGLVSSEFNVTLSDEYPLIISWDWFPKFEGSSSVGQVYFDISDVTNTSWIRV